MKKIILSLIAVSLIISCVNVEGNSNTVVEKQSKIGYDFSDEGEKRDLVAGSIENITIWENYIKAHNERDFDAIRALDSDTFKARGPQGQLVEGIDNHIEFLSQWFDQNSPKWKIKYTIANDVETKDGELMQWVTVGHDLTLTAEGKEVKLSQVIDALISDGKIQEFYVHERVKGENE
ncbi:MAG: hypothetical protein CMC79_02255 [Flavobacteriaceae bacterium]|nr:hypothetical protein [Flavobacteriaceae bacterium]|tara:strand:- start:7167 stop:7700 length:534 start_codon:yes stop_codon:yes gene_type:complete